MVLRRQGASAATVPEQVLTGRGTEGPRPPLRLAKQAAPGARLAPSCRPGSHLHGPFQLLVRNPHRVFLCSVYLYCGVWCTFGELPSTKNSQRVSPVSAAGVLDVSGKARCTAGPVLCPLEHVHIACACGTARTSLHPSSGGALLCCFLHFHTFVTSTNLSF